MKKALVGVLVLTLIVGLTVSVFAITKEENELSLEIVMVSKGVGDTVDKYMNGEITLKEVQDDFEDYSSRARFIYINSLEKSDNPEFIKLTAGFTLAIDLYREGFENNNTKKIETANKMFKHVLTPQIEDVFGG